MLDEIKKKYQEYSPSHITAISIIVNLSILIESCL